MLSANSLNEEGTPRGQFVTAGGPKDLREGLRDEVLRD